MAEVINLTIPAGHTKAAFRGTAAVTVILRNTSATDALTCIIDEQTDEATNIVISSGVSMILSANRSSEILAGAAETSCIVILP